MRKLAHYEVIADLFTYPNNQYPLAVQRVRDLLATDYAKAATELDRFLSLLPADDLLKMQDLYIHTFDVQAITTLDIGYALFGDDYKRGELLANLNREHREAENDCGVELADHLPNVVRLMSKLDDQELLQELVEEILVPALKTMLKEFGTERIKEKNESYEKHYKTLIEAPSPRTEISTLYQYVLKVLYEVLKQDFVFVEKITPVATVDFLSSIQREIEIEQKADNPL
jgi:nitrate reductase assembly molybdenum cofactor insertion protein NarJ